MDVKLTFNIDTYYVDREDSYLEHTIRFFNLIYLFSVISCKGVKPTVLTIVVILL